MLAIVQYTQNRTKPEMDSGYLITGVVGTIRK